MQWGSRRIVSERIKRVASSTVDMHMVCRRRVFVQRWSYLQREGGSFQSVEVIGQGTGTGHHTGVVRVAQCFGFYGDLHDFSPSIVKEQRPFHARFRPALKRQVGGMGGSGGEAVCSVGEHEVVVGRRGSAVRHVSGGVREGFVVPVKVRKHQTVS